MRGKEAPLRLGFALPQCGSAAGPDAIATVAQRAEALGFDSLWVLDRTLYPVNPRAPYPVGDGTLPAKYKRVLDPLETLTFAAAHPPCGAWHERLKPSLVHSGTARAAVDHA